MSQISTPPTPEPMSFMADDFQRSIAADIGDKSHPNEVRGILHNFFKKRQYQLQHKKHKYLQRWSHYALTSELVDKVSLKFSPNYSKIQMEIENCVKRHQRLEGEDHFANPEKRPQRLEPNGTINPDDILSEMLPKSSCLRVDDLDVYTRITSYHENISIPTEKFIQRAKWVPMTHRFDVFTQTQIFFQERRQESLEKQKAFAKACDEKAQKLITDRKMGVNGLKELSMIQEAFPHIKMEKRSPGIREQTMNTAKYTYELPPMVMWNQVELKVSLATICAEFGHNGDMEIDNGNGFSYTVITNFPNTFQASVIKSQFARYDCMPAMMNPAQLGKKDIQKVIMRNQKRYGKTAGGENTLLEVIEIQKQTEKMGVNFINSVERALFGEFNNGEQLEGFPAVRLKKSHWLEMICFKPEISKEQMYQAAILARERTPLDDTCAYMMEIINVNDCANVNLVLEAISQIHYDKLRHGKVKADFLRFDHGDTESYFTEDQKSYLSMFMGSLKVKNEFGLSKKENDNEAIPKNSLFEVPQHLLFSNYLMNHLKAKDKKCSLLYLLNAFRSMQKHITLELRELATRDRVMGECNLVKPRNSGKPKSGASEGDTEETDNSAGQNTDIGGAQDITNVITDELMDINKVRHNKKFSAQIQSTCPIVPKYHATFGEPVERQEVSAEYECLKDQDPKKVQAQSLMNRVDKITENKQHKCWIVTDDYGVNVMYDSALADMQTLEVELIKICSFFINKIEPITDTDMRNILPTVDRQRMLTEIIELEEGYQNQKLQLALSYMECYQHVCDGLEQQRLIQIIIDLMAKRPRINFNANHFRDSYRTETELFKTQGKLVREFINLQMITEAKVNSGVREYLEKTYRLIYEQMDNKWQYYGNDDVADEKEKRRVQAQGVKGDKEIEKVREIEKNKPGMFTAKQNAVDPRQFAEMLGMPFSSLVMLMKEHHERDPLVKQSIHEHVSFIKLQEGHPAFIHDSAVKKQNKIRITKESKEIGILDFYDGLANITKVVAACNAACSELQEVHKADNGFIAATTDLVATQFLLAELRGVRAEQNGDQIVQSRDLEVLQDSSILGNADKMLFYAKELVASAEDPSLLQNPFVLTKIDLQTIRGFDFSDYIVSLEEKTTGKEAKKVEDPVFENNSTAGENPANLAEVNNSTDSVDFGAMLDKDNFTEEMEGVTDGEGDALDERKKKLHQAGKSKLYPRLRGRLSRPDMPSQLEIMCNGVEAMRLRHILIQAIHQRDVLMAVYKSQNELMAKDATINFSDHFNFQSFVTSSAGWTNFVDDGPEQSLQIATNLSIKEFDPSLTTAINFNDPDAFKAIVCPLGLEELRAVVRYELTNLNLLIVGTRTNQILLDNAQRKLAEIDLFSKGFAVANPVFDLYEKLSIKGNLMDNKLNRLAENERGNLQYYIQAKIAPNYYDCLASKKTLRDTCEKQFAQMKRSVRNHGGEVNERTEVMLRQLRTMRVMLAHDFCEEVNSIVCLDSLKMQLLVETNTMRRRAYLLPKEHMIHTIYPSTKGEHEFFYYNTQPTGNEEQKKTAREKGEKENVFFDKSKRQIKDFWAIPLFDEILKSLGERPTRPDQNDEFRKTNKLIKNFDFDVGDVTGKDSGLRHQFWEDKHKAMIMSKVPKMNVMNSKEIDAFIKEKGRIADFKQAYDYSKTQAGKYLNYFHNLQNLFDLQFFMCKLGAKAHSICGLEQFVTSGLPFWDDGDDDEDLEHDEYLDSSEEGGSEKPGGEYSKQNDDVENKTRNALSQRIVQRIAAEKKSKNQLLTDLDQMKDKFEEWGTVMRNMEAHMSIDQAAGFLGEQVQMNFQNIVLVLMSVMDSQSQNSNSQKEIDWVRNTLRHLSHQDDLKVTFSNGFHVNAAITSINRVSLDENIYKQDYENFFKATQPVIDEEGLSPPEFTLLKGIFMVDKLNMRSYIKCPTYLGAIPQRDYSQLDLNLINVNSNFRKLIQANLNANEGVAEQYALARMGITGLTTADLLKPSYAAQVPQATQEKITFQKQVSKARQLKRCLMILMNKSTIPAELDEFKLLNSEFNDVTQWKIMTKMDDIALNRKKKAERDRMRQLKLEKEQLSGTKAIAASVRQESSFGSQSRENESAMQAFDQVSCEVEVYQREIMNYMILKAQTMIERETTALSRAFEMNGKRLEVLIDPRQQFASTFELPQDKKNHLDIINKVAPVQKMLTQFENRCLKIETLTSGSGVVISSKDLNECLKDLCRNIVKFSETEMRTRCEHLAMMLVQYENMLYNKDMQMLNLEHKLTHAKGELQKIVNTKVFARGNNLIYELDKSTRQLRLMKDNVFNLEKDQREKIRLYFDKDLGQARMVLSEEHKKYAEYKEALNTHMNNNIKEDIGYIDILMKKRVEKYKVNSSQAEPAKVSFGIPSKSSNNKFNSYGMDQDQMVEEMERLRESEVEARAEVSMMQCLLRKQRLMNKTKEVLKQQMFDFKMDNMKDQLTSNSALWEQLAEAEKRERVLQQELLRTQGEFANQEKILDRLRDEIKTQQITTNKLLQFKNTKAKRLNELESQAKEKDIMGSLNIFKILRSLEQREAQIKDLKSAQMDNNEFSTIIRKATNNEIDAVKRKLEQETKAKNGLIQNCERLRKEVNILQGDDFKSLNIWKEKITELKEFAHGYLEETDLAYPQQKKVREDPSAYMESILGQSQNQINQQSQMLQDGHIGNVPNGINGINLFSQHTNSIQRLNNLKKSEVFESRAHVSTDISNSLNQQSQQQDIERLDLNIAVFSDSPKQINLQHMKQNMNHPSQQQMGIAAHSSMLEKQAQVGNGLKNYRHPNQIVSQSLDFTGSSKRLLQNSTFQTSVGSGANAVFDTSQVYNTINHGSNKLQAVPMPGIDEMMTLQHNVRNFEQKSGQNSMQSSIHQSYTKPTKMVSRMRISADKKSSLHKDTSVRQISKASNAHKPVKQHPQVGYNVYDQLVNDSIRNSQNLTSFTKPNQTVTPRKANQGVFGLNNRLNVGGSPQPYHPPVARNLNVGATLQQLPYAQPQQVMGRSYQQNGSIPEVNLHQPTKSSNMFSSLDHAQGTNDAACGASNMTNSNYFTMTNKYNNQSMVTTQNKDLNVEGYNANMFSSGNIMVQSNVVQGYSSPGTEGVNSGAGIGIGLNNQVLISKQRTPSDMPGIVYSSDMKTIQTQKQTKTGLLSNKKPENKFAHQKQSAESSSVGQWTNMQQHQHNSQLSMYQPDGGKITGSKGQEMDPYETMVGGNEQPRNSIAAEDRVIGGVTPLSTREEEGPRTQKFYQTSQEINKN